MTIAPSSFILHKRSLSQSRSCMFLKLSPISEQKQGKTQIIKQATSKQAPHEHKDNNNNKQTNNRTQHNTNFSMPCPNLNSEDYYAILGCDRGASEAQLKKAYRKLAVKVRVQYVCYQVGYCIIKYCSEMRFWTWPLPL